MRVRLAVVVFGGWVCKVGMVWRVKWRSVFFDNITVCAIIVDMCRTEMYAKMSVFSLVLGDM